MDDMGPAALMAMVEKLGPWFHNLHLPNAVQTCPGHHFGDFPAFKWREIQRALPRDLSGRKVLDVGCNAGFYSFELAARGATVLGLELDEHYLKQACWASEVLGMEGRVRFRLGSVYDLGDLDAGEFDIIVFMGVFYHLRYPLLALDLLARLQPELMVFQTLTFPDALSHPAAMSDHDFASRHVMAEAGWPRLAFVETSFCGDPTNWWVTNKAGAAAMLRSSGFDIVDEPSDEVFVCRIAEQRPWWRGDRSVETALRAARKIDPDWV